MLKKDLKKHLLRAKQLAEQNFGRADKSEVLPEDLEQLDRRINHIKLACHNVGKKVQLSVKDSGSDKEKRLKKMPEQQLAQQMIDFGGQLGVESLMGSLFNQCGNTQASVARELAEYEVEVESKVLAPIHTMTEQEIPNIQRKKKQLEKLVLDYDTAKSRYISSQEKHRDQPGGNFKIEASQSEMEEAHNKVEQCRDQLSTDMLSFHAKEAENSKFLIDLIKVQADYHEKALKVLQQAIPRMEEICDHNLQMPVFGGSLEEHLQRTNREIASVIEICIAILAEEALEEEGLFRIAGGNSKVKKVKAALDASRVPDMEEIRDIHCIAGALKLYLRELPEPLLTFDLYNEWMQASHLPHDEKLQTLWVLCGKLPKANYNNLRYLIKFLGKLAEKSEINKMSSSNIAIVIGPNLLWPKESGQNVLTTASQSSIAESLIAHSDYFFPGEIVYKPIERKPSPVVTEKKPQHSSSVKYLSLGKRKGKSKDRSSLDSALTAASQTLTLPVSKPQNVATTQQKSPQAQVIGENEELSSPSKLAGCNQVNQVGVLSDVDDQQSIDSGIESSSSGPLPQQQPSIHIIKRSNLTGLTRPTTIFEAATDSGGSGGGAGVKLDPIKPARQRRSDSSLLHAHSSLVTEKSCKRAITPPPRPPPRSVHSDMYDTMFMLQTLKGGGTSPEGDTSVTDYLTKVRTIWDDQYKSPSNRFSIGPTHAEINTGEEEVSFDFDHDLRKDRTRASSEPKLLENGLAPQELVTFEEEKKSSSIKCTEGDKGDTTTTTAIGNNERSSSKDVQGSVDKEDSSAEASTRMDDRGTAEEVLEVPKRKKNIVHGEIDFGISNVSEKSTPPGTLNRAPPPAASGHVIDQDTASVGSGSTVSSSEGVLGGSHVPPIVHNHQQQHQQHQPITKSTSGNNLVPEGTTGQESTSPAVRRKVPKKPAPLPPTAIHPLDKTGSLERRMKPPVSADKPLLVSTTTITSTAADRTASLTTTPNAGDHKTPMLSPAADHKPPPIPERPTLGPPPAVPNKPPQSPVGGEGAEPHQQGGGAKLGSPLLPPPSPGKPDRPKPLLDRPSMAPPDKPISPAYDSSGNSRTNNGGSPQYGLKPSGDSKTTEGTVNTSTSSNNTTSSSDGPIGSPIISSSRSGSSIKSHSSKPPPRPHPPPKHGSRGSDKDFQFVKDDLGAAGGGVGHQMARKKSTKEEEGGEGTSGGGGGTGPPSSPAVARQESKNVETRM